MYGLVLLVHSWLRWAVLAAGIAAAFGGRSREDTGGKWFVILLDLQIVLGLLLYFVLSPYTKTAMADFGAAMGNSQLRFFAVEHLFGMLIGTALAHIGRKKIRNAPIERRGRLALIFYGLAMVAILLSIPWPGMPAGRPLFRF